jgi:hypothetical protein
MPHFIRFLFHRLALRRVRFTYSNFAWGLHGRGREVVWSRAFMEAAIYMIVVIRKVSNNSSSKVEGQKIF